MKGMIGVGLCALLVLVNTAEAGKVRAGCAPKKGFEFKLPDLPYAYDALEPAIDEETMMAHHDRHHAGYVRNLNAALADEKKTCKKPLKLTDLLENLAKMNLSDESKRTTLRNNAGGHFNHQMYWQVMSPDGSEDDISRDLSAAIATKFGSLEDLKADLLGAAGKVFGSGWAWLCVDFEYKDLMITTTPNQDNPLMDAEWVDTRCHPILGVDVWEHAYYLKRKWARAEYLEAFWTLINWREVSANFNDVQ